VIEDDPAGSLARDPLIAELTEAVAARDTFIAVAAHELRNPMTPILGQIDLLLAAVRERRCSPEQVEHRLERIQHTVRRYVKRSAVLFDVSRINGSGSSSIRSRSISPGCCAT
jgi:signal transduction histidine kinase